MRETYEKPSMLWIFADQMNLAHDRAYSTQRQHPQSLQEAWLRRSGDVFDLPTIDK